jgi:hypothetical protein
LKRYRRHSLVVIVTLSAIITPPDVFSQVLVALPLMVLYEIGIAISRRIMKQQDAEQAARETPVKTKKKSSAEEPETGKKESAKEEVSSKKPWKRAASKPDSEEGEKPDQEDSDAEDDKTD